MKCVSCQKELWDDEIYCHTCGAKQPIGSLASNSPTETLAEPAVDQPVIVRSEPAEVVPPAQPLPPANRPAPKANKPKKAWLAVVLNLFPLVMGLGYLYLGKPKRFAVVFLLQLFSLAPMTWLGLGDYNAYVLWAIFIGSWIDVYIQATRHNSKVAAAVA